MRIIRFIDQTDSIQLGEDIGQGQARLLEGGLFDARPTSRQVSVKKLLAPFIPSNIFCIGLNYREHAREGGQPIPERPVVFMKPTSTITNPGDEILLPRCAINGPETDYECELAVIIGKAGRDIPEADALSHVFGYTAANDVSARHWQRQGGAGQWVRGKSFDTFCPLGPAIVTADEIPDPQTLGIKTILSGEVMQDHTTADMIFPVAKLIAFLSQDTTLLPGTLILTGTPQGVGCVRKPPRWLTHGDEVVVEVERIGTLRNPVRDA